MLSFGFAIVALLCSVAVVDCLGKTQILIQCSCLIAPLHGYMNQHCEEPRCSFQMLEGRLPIDNNATLFTFYHNDQSWPPCISSGAVGMTIGLAGYLNKVFKL